jgi:hypothetical protein
MTTLPDASAARQLLASRAAYVESFDLLLGLAVRELRIFDPDLAQLELESPGRLERLGELLRQDASVRVHVALHDPASLLARMPRTRRLFALFATQVAVRRTFGEAARAQDCFVIADAEHLVRRPVVTQARGVLLCGEAHQVAPCLERFEAVWESSEPAAPATTLGL